MASLYDEDFDEDFDDSEVDVQFDDGVNDEEFDEILFGHSNSNEQKGDEKVQQFLKMFEDKINGNEVKYSGSSSSPSSNNRFEDFWAKFEKKIKGDSDAVDHGFYQTQLEQKYNCQAPDVDDQELLTLMDQVLAKEQKFSSNGSPQEMRYVSSEPVEDYDTDVSTDISTDEDYGEDEDTTEVDHALLEELNKILPSDTEQKFCGYSGSNEQKYCGYNANEQKYCGYNADEQNYCGFITNQEEEKYCGCSGLPTQRAPSPTPALEQKFCGCSKQVAQNFAYHVANLPPQQAEKALIAKTNELVNQSEDKVGQFLSEYVKTVTELLDNGDAKEITYTTRCSSPTECKTTTTSRIIPKSELSTQAHEMERLHQRMHRECLLRGNTESQIYDNVLVSYLLHVKTFLKPFDTQNQNYFGKYCYRAIEMMKQINPRITYGEGDNNCSEIKKYVARITASLELKPFVQRACSTPEQMSKYKHDHANGIAHLTDVVQAFRQLTVSQREQFLVKHQIIGKFVPGIQQFSLRDLARNQGPLLYLGYSPWAVDRAGVQTPMNSFKLLQ